MSEERRLRTVRLNLTDDDCKRLFEKAAAHGLTVASLLENFIADLICGAGTNGSDERGRAQAWFDRCWFGMFPDDTFLKWLIEWGGSVDDFIIHYDLLKEAEADLQEEEDPEAREAIQEEIDFQKEELQDYYNEYVSGSEEPQSYDEAIAEILKYKADYEAFIEDEGVQ